MQIPEFFSSQLALDPQSGSTVRTWTAGQILQATVVRQAMDGTLTLRVGNQEVRAQSGLALAADQPLTLQVAQSGTQVVLRVLNVANAGATAVAVQPQTVDKAPAEQTILSQAWRQVLPREGDWRPLLAALPQQQAMHAETPSAAGLPPVVVAAIRTLVATLPTPDTLSTATGLRQAVADSGLFLENHLARAAQQGAPPMVQNDIKAALVQLVSTLRAVIGPTPESGNPVNTAAPALGPLLQQADAALARLEQNQLTALALTTSTPAPLMVDLPVRTEPLPTLVSLQIEEDHGRGSETADKIWNVWLRFDFDALGHVEARVSLQGETVSIGLWAEQHATATLFNDHLAELDGTLKQAGLMTTLNCQDGRPRAPATGTTQATSPPLLDERA